MKLLLIVAALVAVLVACAAPVAPPRSGDCRMFVASSEFTKDERDALDRAVARWNEIAVEQFCVRTAESGEEPRRLLHGVFRVVYQGAEWRSRSNGNDFIGMHYGGVDQIAIAAPLPIALFEEVALHELGHAHALTHTVAPSIMHASTGTASDFTPNDMAECQRVGACRKEDSDGG